MARSYHEGQQPPLTGRIPSAAQPGQGVAGAGAYRPGQGYAQPQGYSAQGYAAQSYGAQSAGYGAPGYPEPRYPEPNYTAPPQGQGMPHHAMPQAFPQPGQPQSAPQSAPRIEPRQPAMAGHGYPAPSAYSDDRRPAPGYSVPGYPSQAPASQRPMPQPGLQSTGQPAQAYPAQGYAPQGYAPQPQPAPHYAPQGYAPQPQPQTQPPQPAPLARQADYVPNPDYPQSAEYRPAYAPTPNPTSNPAPHADYRDYAPQRAAQAAPQHPPRRDPAPVAAQPVPPAAPKAKPAPAAEAPQERRMSPARKIASVGAAVGAAAQDAVHSAGQSVAQNAAQAGAAMGPGRMGRALNAAGAALSVALVAGVGIWSYRLMVRDVTGVPVIRALAGPARISPEDPGGRQAAYQGLSVNTVAAEGGAGGAAQSIALAPQPVGLTQEDRSTAVLSARAQDPITAPPPAIAPGAGTLVGAEANGQQSASPLQILPASLPGVSRSPFPRRRGSPSFIPRLAPGVTETTIAAAEPVAPATPAPAAASPGTAAATGAASSDAQAEALLQELVTRLGSPRVTEIDPGTLTPGTRVVQLGVYDDEAAARGAWEQISTRFPSFLQDRGRIVEAATSGGRVFYRLRAASFADEPEARRFCTMLMAENIDCIPALIR